MIPLVRLAEILAVQVGVDLGGRDVGVPQQLLHDDQIRPSFKQMRGATVPQRVR